MGAAIFAQLIGSLLQNGQMQQALAMRQQAANLYGDQFIPQLDKMVALQLPPDQVSRWTQATAATQGQGQALSALEQEVAARGETPEDTAAFLNARQQAGNIASSQNAAALRSLASRGLASSGLGVAAEQQAGQNASNTANAADVNEAAQARQRYLQSVGALANTAGQQRGQEMQAMSAQDALNEYNLNNAMAAQQFNLNLPLQVFNARMQLAQGRANALGGVANQYNNIGQTYANQGGGVANALATYAQQPQGSPGYYDPSQNPYGPGGSNQTYQYAAGQHAPPQYSPSDPGYWSSYTTSGTPGWGQ